MSTRKATETADEKPAKRARLKDDCVASDSVIVSFASINSDCKVNILSFLSSEDMNSFAICNKDCRKVRSNESLDQTRTATVVLTQSTTGISFCKKIREMGHVFTGNRTKLKIEGLESFNIADETFGIYKNLSDGRGVRLDGVTTLDCSCVHTQALNVFFLVHLCEILSNLQVCDFTGVTARSYFGFLMHVAAYCPALSKLVWNQCRFMRTDAYELANFSNLTQIEANGVSLYPLGVSPGDMFMKCLSLDRLSIIGAKLITELDNDGQQSVVPLEQEHLINLVRRHPTLRWLRSDLTVENIAMLKQRTARHYLCIRMIQENGVC